MERVYLKLYDPADTYVSMTNKVRDAAEVIESYPAARYFPFIVHTDEGGEVMYGFYNLSAMMSKYGIDRALTGAEAVQAVEDAMNAEQEAQEEEAAAYVSPEERIAASLEFQTLTSLSDVDEEEA